ncbi:hypothetical protein MPSEU_000183600 [Mayamaea pseudoterrestris]|nr:hypothetical protein MPSEU_000183600 [Mayamaea pseudoterrestris]
MPTYRRLALAVVASVLLPYTCSFSVQNLHVHQQQSSMTRSGFFQTVVTAAALTITATPLVANADVTAKLASSTALRKVKSCQNKLATLETAISETDYLAVRQSLREAPCSDLRKSMTTLVKGAEDGSNAQEISAKYKTFISSLETLDAKAGLGLRGQSISVEEMTKYYQAVLINLREFLEAAQAAAEVPLQYNDDIATGSQ